jgi:hypothetical protein
MEDVMACHLEDDDDDDDDDDFLYYCFFEISNEFVVFRH